MSDSLRALLASLPDSSPAEDERLIAAYGSDPMFESAMKLWLFVTDSPRGRLPESAARPLTDDECVVIGEMIARAFPPV
jgi:hypothetical protein